MSLGEKFYKHSHIAWSDPCVSPQSESPKTGWRSRSADHDDGNGKVPRSGSGHLLAFEHERAVARHAGDRPAGEGETKADGSRETGADRAEVAGVVRVRRGNEAPDELRGPAGADD